MQRPALRRQTSMYDCELKNSFQVHLFYHSRKNKNVLVLSYKETHSCEFMNCRPKYTVLVPDMVSIAMDQSPFDISAEKIHAEIKCTVSYGIVQVSSSARAVCARSRALSIMLQLTYDTDSLITRSSARQARSLAFVWIHDHLANLISPPPSP